MEHHLRIAETLTEVLENKFSIFGLRFGLDPLLDIIPWAGDALAALLSLYLVWIGVKLGLPEAKIQLMLRNIILDFIIGAIPFVGIVGDVFYRSNSRNLRILKEHAMQVVEATIVSPH